MEKNPVQIKYRSLSKDPLFLTTVFGFLLRLAFLIFILTVGRELSTPYFIADDIKYENLAQLYINSARNVIDMTVFKDITAGYLQLFWPWVMCVSGYIFKSIYVSRFINVILSAACIPVIYFITKKISGNHKTALTASMLFAFMPITVMTCAFPIKDIFITFAVLYILNVFLSVQYEEKIKIYNIIITVILLICIYLTRGAVSELLIVFFACIYIIRYIKSKNHTAILICIAVLAVALILFGGEFISAFDTKIDTYSDYGDGGEGIFGLRINSITDIYKLPFTYFFATLQPVKINLFSDGGAGYWLNIMTALNISIYPIAIGNFIYIFKKKKNLLFWLFTTVFYCAVIILSLGIFRHYLFLLPVQMINYSLYAEENKPANALLSIALSAFMLLGVFGLSILAI